jgi:hypothetical protein
VAVTYQIFRNVLARTSSDVRSPSSARSHHLTLRPPDLVLTLALFIGSALFVSRGWSRLVKPGMWAEDGTRFFPESHTLGLGSIAHPFAGYIHVLPRLIALVLRLVPLGGVPEAYTLAAVSVSLAIFSTVLSKRLAWLIPSRIARGLIFVLLCLLPDFSEPYGNLANLIFVGAVAALFLGLADDPESVPGRILELVAIAILVLSGPLSILTFPVYLHRIWRSRTRHSLAAMSVFALGSCVQLYVYFTSDRMTPGGGSAEIYAKTVGIRLPGTWMAGSLQWRNDWIHGNMALYGTVWILLVVLVAVFTLRLVGALILLVAALALGAAVSAYGPVILMAGVHRHFLLPLTVVLTVIVGSAARRLSDVQRHIAEHPTRLSLQAVASGAMFVIAVGVVALGAKGVQRDFQLPAYSPRPNMSQLQPCLAMLGPQCRTSEAPPGWYVRLTREPVVP